ncbi:hypothetical protein NHX12_032431 [Muraenolepis orangiensis]|uniref:Uncharacterized protein n=1 Tax=Muraenolepis orangiensis TaxID=630683 RepID=A0A9Q0E7T5_9TELE|nr:hypothetical protein NHX12_032431 [Muraenolepis orangiensis]
MGTSLRQSPGGPERVFERRDLGPRITSQRVNERQTGWPTTPSLSLLGFNELCTKSIELKGGGACDRPSRSVVGTRRARSWGPDALGRGDPTRSVVGTPPARSWGPDPLGRGDPTRSVVGTRPARQTTHPPVEERFSRNKKEYLGPNYLVLDYSTIKQNKKGSEKQRFTGEVLSIGCRAP